jgi:hypothetical protein
MKTKNVHKVAKRNRFDIMNDSASHLMFSSFPSHYWKKIYQRMYYEKFYNLQSSAYFIFALFAFKIDKILRVQISTVWTLCTFSVQDKFSFFNLPFKICSVQIIELFTSHLSTYLIFFK